VLRVTADSNIYISAMNFGGAPDRSTLPSQRIARMILCFHQGTLVVLHGFIKKTRKTPADDLALAKRRMKEVTT
jgi:phage-related protein